MKLSETIVALKRIYKTGGELEVDSLVTGPGDLVVFANGHFTSPSTSLPVSLNITEVDKNDKEEPESAELPPIVYRRKTKSSERKLTDE